MMAFYSNYFSFDGTSCADFQLQLYDIDGSDSLRSEIASVVTIEDETVGKRWKPFFYGVKYERKLEFDIVFGVNTDRLDRNQTLTRAEIDNIATWLTGHNGYKTLEFDQLDMRHLAFKAIVTELSIETNGNEPYAFRAHITCDSPFAYERLESEKYTINGTKELSFFNDSSVNDYYYPTIKYYPTSGGDFEITNLTDGERKFSIEDIPASIEEVSVNSDTCVITNDKNINLYEHCNFMFPRFKRGLNQLSIVGNGDLIIQYEFLRNVGG